MEKKILNEINDMRVKMGLPILNENSILLSEAGVISTLVGKIIGGGVIKNALTPVEKGLLTKFVAGTLKGTEKSEFNTLINSTKGLSFIKEFENAIASETNLITKQRAQAYLDKNIKPQLNTTVGGIPGTGKPPTTAPIINNVTTVTKEIIDNSLYSYEKLYPNLFRKGWFWSYVNQSRINGIRQEILRDFQGKDAKGIETIIQDKLSQSENVLQNLKIPNKQKTLLGEELSEFKGEIKRNYPKMGVKIVGATIISYLLYNFFREWYETGTPIGAAMSLPFTVWGDVKKNFKKYQPHDNTPEGFLKYVIEKYGDKDYKNPKKFKLRNVDGIIRLTPKNGKTKSFKHNGNTFIELN
jgi:hypothetical protein